MRLTGFSPMLETKNLSKSIQWYQEILGFELQDHLPDLGWASLVKDDVRIMLMTRVTQRKHSDPVLTGSFYFYTSEVDAWWEALKGKVPVEYPLETYSYGMREFAIRDINGYLLQFGTYAVE
ncbi:MAG: VOC family protein [Bacteroidia bacterium]|nr:VOC family protein [Bacteroidia bacterium]